MNRETIENARESIRIEAAAVERMAPVVDLPEFSAAVEMLATCPRITTCASGTSGIAAKKFAHSLCCIERTRTRVLGYAGAASAGPDPGRRPAGTE